MKATKTTVTIGHLEVDGYLLADGKLGMSLSDIARIVGIESKQGGSAISRNKWVKSLVEKGFEGPAKVTTTEGNHASVIDLDWVVPIVQCLARAGNELAWEFLNAIGSVMLQKLFSDAFNIRFETEEIQAGLKVRLEGIEKRNQWTDAIKAYGDTHPVSDNWRQFVYSNVSDRLNRALTGKPSKHWCDKFECTSRTLRDHWADRHLGNIDAIERHATVLCIKGLEPMDALNQAIEFFDLPVNDNPVPVASKEALRMRAKRGSKLPH